MVTLLLTATDSTVCNAFNSFQLTQAEETNNSTERSEVLEIQKEIISKRVGV